MGGWQWQAGRWAGIAGQNEVELNGELLCQWRGSI